MRHFLGTFRRPVPALTVGVAVGATVGATVDVTVGSTVGVTVGATVGAAIDATVGAAVGALLGPNNYGMADKGFLRFGTASTCFHFPMWFAAACTCTTWYSIGSLLAEGVVPTVT